LRKSRQMGSEVGQQLARYNGAAVCRHALALQLQADAPI
jgi:hypothetical protein